MAKVYSGIKNRWQVIQQVGKGDAGEVFLVESEGKITQGILKRPLQIATGGTIIRQAMQIEIEGDILFKLEGLDINSHANLLRVPRLYDTSIPGTTKTANYFIVSEQASGVSLSDLLIPTRSDTQSISTLDLLSIITALFDLFKVIHSKGIFWNDVKADHIFFDKKAKTIHFIDWGNGKILLGQEDNSEFSYSILSDYQQMIQEIRSILLPTKPDLIWDLGWPLESNVKLDKHQLKQLEKRVEYAYEYLHARLIEYKRLEQIYYDRADNLEALKEIIKINQSILLLGEGVKIDPILQITKKLLLTSAQRKDILACRALLDCLPDQYIKENKSWEFIRLVTYSNEIDKSKGFYELLVSIFNQDWSESLWLVKDMLDRIKPTTLWQQLFNYFRQETHSFVEQPIDYLNTISDDLHVSLIRQRIEKSAPDKVESMVNLSASIDDVIVNWSATSKKGYFGNDLLRLRTGLISLLENDVPVPGNLINIVNEMIANVRTMINAWNDSDFELARKKIHGLFILDPQFGGLIELDQDLKNIEEWTNSFKTGPQSNQSIISFLESLENTKPQVEEKLGIPNWLSLINQSIAMIKASPDMQSIRTWAEQSDLPLPWIYDDNLLLHDSKHPQKEIVLDGYQKKIINQFHDNLRRGETLTPILGEIKKSLPSYYFIYEKIGKAFANIFSSLENDDIEIPEEQSLQEDMHNICEAKRILQILITWRKYIQADNFISAGAEIDDSDDWSLIILAREAQNFWQNTLRPTIALIKQKQWKENTNPKSSNKEDIRMIIDCVNNLHLSYKNWLAIEKDGLTLTNSEILVQLIESAQRDFAAFWRSIEKSQNQPLRLIAFYNRDILASVYQELTQLAHYARNIKNALDVIYQPVMSRTRLSKSSAGDLMFNLERMDKGLKSSNQESRITEWQKTYQKLINITSNEALQEELQSIDRMHPLFAWFSTLAKQGEDSNQLLTLRGW